MNASPTLAWPSAGAARFPARDQAWTRWLVIVAVGLGHGLVCVWLLRAKAQAAPPSAPPPLRATWIELPAPPRVEPAPPLPSVPVPSRPATPRTVARPTPKSSILPVVPAAAAPETPPPVALASPAPTARESAAPAITPPPAPMPVIPPRFEADYLSNPPPEYPRLARNFREQGQVLLRVRVSADGAPLTVGIETGSGYERLDQAALAAVRQWRFVPARQGEAAVEAWVRVPISFSLRS